MATNRTGPKDWPYTQEERRKQVIELAKGAERLLKKARKDLDNREHPAVVGLAVADATNYLVNIQNLMLEAKLGLPYENDNTP